MPSRIFKSKPKNISSNDSYLTTLGDFCSVQVPYKLAVIQRDYVWNNFNIEEFLYSSNHEIEQNVHGDLGTFIICSEGQEKELYDGQQRIISILLIGACAYRFISNNFDSQEIALRFLKLITTNQNPLFPELIFSEPLPRRLLSKIISEKTVDLEALIAKSSDSSEISLAKNAEEILKYWETENYSVNDFKKIINYLENITVNVRETDDRRKASQLFNNNNNFGRPLTGIERCRACLIDRCSGEKKKLAAREIWKSIDKSIIDSKKKLVGHENLNCYKFLEESLNIDKFMSDFIRSELEINDDSDLKAFLNHPRLYLEKNFHKIGDPYDFLLRAEKKFEALEKILYNRILNPRSCFDPILNILGWYPEKSKNSSEINIISVINAFIDLDLSEEVNVERIDIVADYWDKFIVMNIRTNDNKISNTAAHHELLKLLHLSKIKDPVKLANILEFYRLQELDRVSQKLGYSPEDITGLQLNKNNKLIKVLLARREIFMRKKYGDKSILPVKGNQVVALLEQLTSNSVDIEHNYPDPKDKDLNKLETKRNERRHCWNLTLLGKSLNSSLRDKTYKSKLPNYARDSLFHPRLLASGDRAIPTKHQQQSFKKNIGAINLDFGMNENQRKKLDESFFKDSFFTPVKASESKKVKQDYEWYKYFSNNNTRVENYEKALSILCLNGFITETSNIKIPRIKGLSECNVKIHFNQDKSETPNYKYDSRYSTAKSLEELSRGLRSSKRKDGVSQIPVKNHYTNWSLELSPGKEIKFKEFVDKEDSYDGMMIDSLIQRFLEGMKNKYIL